MSYTDLRDFEAEYVKCGQYLNVEIEKLGGGTLGKAYEGHWRYRVTEIETGDVLYQGQDLHTGTPKTHAEAVRLLMDFLMDSILDSPELAELLAEDE
jgi:hypothetical protein